MKNLAFLLFGLVAVGLAFSGGQPPFGAAGPTPATATTAPETAASGTAAAAASGRTAAPLAGTSRFTPEGIALARDASGQFHIELAVNGAPTRFLVDTGADLVALTEADAQRAGIAVDPGAYRPILRTASGEGMGLPVRLERLELGQTELRDVAAVVVRDLDTSLLGQSVLGRIGRVELRGDAMVLEPAH